LLLLLLFFLKTYKAIYFTFPFNTNKHFLIIVISSHAVIALAVVIIICITWTSTWVDRQNQ